MQQKAERFRGTVIICRSCIFCRRSSVAEHQLPKLDMRVRFPSPAFYKKIKKPLTKLWNCGLISLLRDSSTVGSTPPCQGGGREFESRLSLLGIGRLLPVLFLSYRKLCSYRIKMLRRLYPASGILSCLLVRWRSL